MPDDTDDERKLNVKNNHHRGKELRNQRAQNDPCLLENEMAMRCLDENAYDREKCRDFFKNYKNCRKFWSWIVSQRKKQGIEPNLPPPEERDQVKKDYLPMLLTKS
ncbi:unnamed protein product [Lymnaea stagnalis]|uniref:Coiled-coil-helix-coiled-coil-helix domain-containing protein 7 n=1 Tax=Lymnaea stagnalis TaxID=6523 RepID=A0AAV2I0R8_LYMST